MFNISNNGIIEVTRGDSFTMSLTINMGTALEPLIYELKKWEKEDGEWIKDKVYFGVMEANQKFEDALITKAYDVDSPDYDIENAELIIRFEPEDTEYLLPGNYYYQVKLYRVPESSDDGYAKVDTIISKTKFVILD